jgi:hypothetical protein
MPDTLPDSLGAKIMLRQKELQQERDYYEDRDELVARFVNPRRELIKDSQRFDDKGERRGRKAYSGIPNSALSVWADGMQGHMVSQSLRWFKSVLGNRELNEVDEVQMWLQEYDQAMYAEFQRSNFYAILGEWFRDAGSLGTATLYTEEDIKNKSAVHTPIHLREILIAEDKYGNVDTVHRKFFLTARQAYDKFGDKVSKAIKDNAKNHPEKKHEFIHAVFPNNERMYGSMLSKDKPWSSVYIETSGGDQMKKQANVVRQSGYDMNPYAVWRLRKNSDEIYGYSPAHDAMTTILAVNQMDKTLLQAAQLAVNPALNVPEHMRGNTRIVPNGHNYYERGGDTITQIGNQANYPIGIDREERMQRIIEDKYRVEFFMILARAEREMTATEVMERQSEKAVLLGPQVDRLIQEGLTKVFDVVSDIADKAGRLPIPPDIVFEAAEVGAIRGVDIQFTGPLAQAQKMLFNMRPIKNALNELAQASVVFPNVLKRVNEDKLAEAILDSTDFPQDLMYSDEEYAERMAAEAQAIAEQQAQEQAQQMAEAYPKVSGAPEEGSPASAIGEMIGG